MHESLNEAEAWKRLVLRSMPPPAWLSADAPERDVVLSTRARVMRNLKGHRFTHIASDEELAQIGKKITAAAQPMGLEAFTKISNAERDYLVACRLASPHLEWTKTGRSLLLNQDRSLSLMIHEEDHLRLQALTAGYSAGTAEVLSKTALRTLAEHLDFAHSPHFGYLSASPYNVGRGRRLSAMFHLIGLAQAKRLPSVLQALADRGITVRGLFGESSRAVGAFLQVSTVGGAWHDFTGACEYLLREERDARYEVGRIFLEEKAKAVHAFAIGSRTLSLADALRVLAWVRWASLFGIRGFPEGPRQADFLLTTMELRTGGDNEKAAMERAGLVKTILRPM